MLIQNNENSVILTPFGSLIRRTPAESNAAKSWKAKLRAVALFFLSLGVWRNLSAH